MEMAVSQWWGKFKSLEVTCKPKFTSTHYELLGDCRNWGPAGLGSNIGILMSGSWLNLKRKVEDQERFGCRHVDNVFFLNGKGSF